MLPTSSFQLVLAQPARIPQLALDIAAHLALNLIVVLPVYDTPPHSITAATLVAPHRIALVGPFVHGERHVLVLVQIILESSYPFYEV